MIKFKFLRWENFDKEDFINRLLEVDPNAVIDIRTSDNPFDSFLTIKSTLPKESFIPTINKYTPNFIDNAKVEL